MKEIVVKRKNVGKKKMSGRFKEEIKMKRIQEKEEVREQKKEKSKQKG